MAKRGENKDEIGITTEARHVDNTQRIRSNMASVPDSELQALMVMDEYDKMLGIDRISRQYGITPKQIEAKIRAMQAGGSSNDIEVDDTMFVPSKEGGDNTPNAETGMPTYLPDAEKYRLQYDPSVEGVARQSQINQAIVCPHCSAPLGIPSTRPIKVNCPNCMQEATFFN